MYMFVFSKKSLYENQVFDNLISIKMLDTEIEHIQKYFYKY